MKGLDTLSTLTAEVFLYFLLQNKDIIPYVIFIVIL